MEAKNGGLERNFPFRLGDFLGFMLIFGGGAFTCLGDHQNGPRFQPLQRG